ncbi:hypothetical protein ERJ75_000822500 [Trypanosoma vivax]|uniref:Uncharacterized protein n=1 Tax=Trypanosoma vivax (strain Y486) TaxID=1055687 RepID=G0UBI3_TRYVY|nr:hypothetical protein TRVL_03680 [Trypanosoma vivax]KAH8612986.1 hypothetical protein ERJ75_000822500 [Trypanosoma vivax]CCC53179.1 conserved hypothetical protein [Trypanosoma vivax Y486]
MSRQVSLISAGAAEAIFQVAATIVNKATGGRVQTATATAADRHAVVVGPETPVGVHTAVTEAAQFVRDTAYANVSTILVRAVLPRSPPDTVQLRDAVDVYAAAGIDTQPENDLATDSFRRSAEIAIAKAKAKGVSRVTLVVKQASKYNKINDLFQRVASHTIEAAGLATEVLGTAVVANQLIVSPESLGVVFLNDVAQTENIELAYAGIIGGVSRTYHTVGGGKISAGHSYKSVALAVAQELRELGLKSEAEKVEAAAVKNPKTVVSVL